MSDEEGLSFKIIITTKKMKQPTNKAIKTHNGMPVDVSILFNKFPELLII